MELRIFIFRLVIRLFIIFDIYLLYFHIIMFHCGHKDFDFVLMTTIFMIVDDKLFIFHIFKFDDDPFIFTFIMEYGRGIR